MKELEMKKGPYIKDQNNNSKMMRNLMIALIPIILFSFYKNGIIPFVNDKTNIFGLFYPLIFILISSLTTVVSEIIYKKITKEDIKYNLKNSYSIFPGLFLSLILPIQTPIPVLILGAVFASVVGKMIFGGFGKNIFNPALIGGLFIMTTYASTFAPNVYLNKYELDAVTTATPLTNVTLIEGIGTYDTLVKPYGNLTDFLIGTIPGSLGETSALLCILGFIYLTVTKVIKWKIPVVYILTVFGMTYLIGSINGLGIWYPLFQILSGGLMFGAIFMATDPVTSPTISVGQILYGLFLGILTVIFRYLTSYPEGVRTAILTMNLLVVIIDKIGYKARFNFNKAVIPFVVAWFLIVSLSLYIGNSFKTVKTIDSRYNILSKESTGNITTYLTTYKGYSGNIKAEIVIDDGIVIKYEVIEQKDSFYNKIIDADYVQTLINEQNNLSKVDTISGATVSSNALKNMLINTLNDYKGNN